MVVAGNGYRCFGGFGVGIYALLGARLRGGWAGAVVRMSGGAGTVQAARIACASGVISVR